MEDQFEHRADQDRISRTQEMVYEMTVGEVMAGCGVAIAQRRPGSGTPQLFPSPAVRLAACIRFTAQPRGG